MNNINNRYPRISVMQKEVPGKNEQRLSVRTAKRLEKVRHEVTGESCMSFGTKYFHIQILIGDCT